MNKINSYTGLRKQPIETSIMTSLCREFVFNDEEFSNHPVVKENMNNAGFWIDLAERTTHTVEGHIVTENIAKKLDNITLLDFLLAEIYRNTAQKLILNDIIIQTTTSYLDSYNNYED